MKVCTYVMILDVNSCKVIDNFVIKCALDYNLI